MKDATRNRAARRLVGIGSALFAILAAFDASASRNMLLDDELTIATPGLLPHYGWTTTTTGPMQSLCLLSMSVDVAIEGHQVAEERAGLGMNVMF